MHRLTINLSHFDFEKIKTNAHNKSLSLSAYTCSLIRIGLHVEQTLAENSEQSGWSVNINNPTVFKKILKNLLAWQLESRYLLRFMIEHLCIKRKLAPTNLLAEAKIIARKKVNVLVGDSENCEDF